MEWEREKYSLDGGEEQNQEEGREAGREHCIQGEDKYENKGESKVCEKDNGKDRVIRRKSEGGREREREKIQSEER